MTCDLPPTLLEYVFFPSHLCATCRAYLADTSLNGIFGAPLRQYVGLFLVTCLLEFPFYRTVLRHRKLVSQVFIVIVINLATHPLVVLGFPQFFALQGLSKVYSVLAGELFAPLLEFGFLAVVLQIPWKRSLAVAGAANLFSWWFGGWLFSIL